MTKQKLRLASALLWNAAFVIIPMQVPVLTGAIVDGLTGATVSIYGVSLGAAAANSVLVFGALGLLLVAMGYCVSSFGQTMASAKLTRNFVASLRKQLIEHISLLSLAQQRQYGSGELLERVVGDTRSMRQFLDRVFIRTTSNAIRLGYPIIALLLIDPLMAMCALGVLLPQWGISRILQRKLLRAARKRRSNQSNMTTVVKEHLDGVETIKALNADAISRREITEVAESVEDTEISAHRFSALISANVWFMTSFGIAVIWWMGGSRVLSGEMTLGSLIVFTGLVAFLYAPFRMFTKIEKTYQQGLVSLERILDILSIPVEIKDAPDAQPLIVSEGRVEFRNVSFSYSKTVVLHEMDATIEAGSFTAIVGASGSGKSTLLKLIVRLYEPWQGSITIDSQGIHAATLASLRQNVALVPQHSLLFTGTVLDNIRFARPEATIAEVNEVCDIVGLTEIIAALPEGLLTRVGRGGSSLSGGQLQRVALARALMMRPKVLLLDEPTSALDLPAAKRIITNMRKWRPDVTLVVVVHQLELARMADTMLVMEGGKQIEPVRPRVTLARGGVDPSLLGDVALRD